MKERPSIFPTLFLAVAIGAVYTAAIFVIDYCNGEFDAEYLAIIQYQEATDDR